MDTCARALAAALLVAAAPLRAQEAAGDAPPDSGWTHTLVSGLTLTQVSFTNWAQGGENAIAYAVSAEGGSTLAARRLLWEQQYRFVFGQTRLGDQGLRKTEDAIDLAGVITWKTAGRWNPYASATLRTQFAPGYRYGAGGSRTQVSRFFDPAYLTQAVGVRYEPVPQVRTRLGAALREVVTSRFTAYADDPATASVEKTDVAGGLESVTDLEWKPEQNILVASRLSIFGPFSDPGQPVVQNRTTLTGSVTPAVTATLGFELLYDRIVSRKAQFKQSIALGIRYTLL